MPGQNVAVRGEIDRWLGVARLHPRIVGEFDDSALMKVFAEAGEGYFPAPVLLSEEICARYGVIEVGRVDEVREAFWLISIERGIQHSEVRAVLEAARTGCAGLALRTKQAVLPDPGRPCRATVS